MRSDKAATRNVAVRRWRPICCALTPYVKSLRRRLASTVSALDVGVLYADELPGIIINVELVADLLSSDDRCARIGEISSPVMKGAVMMSDALNGMSMSRRNEALLTLAREYSLEKMRGVKASAWLLRGWEQRKAYQTWRMANLSRPQCRAFGGSRRECR